ncbi:MAG: type 1 glutamine amidotransferase domain-containing protein [Neisseria sp.]|nr:type 1 glutamine amidotransferase domain-containing protein [Neisseria sp.]
MLKKTVSTIALALGLAVATPALADTAASSNVPSKGKVLLVTTSADELTFKDGRIHRTGYFLGELTEPAQELIKAGYEVVVATPDGNTPPVDKNSINPALFGNSAEKMSQAMTFALTHPSMQKPTKLAEAIKNLNQYDGLYVPGGHGPMVDLMQDENLGKALRHFQSKNQAIAMLCHGPIAFAAALDNPAAFRQAMVNGDTAIAQRLAKDWIFKGYNMTVYSTLEEKGVEDWLQGKIEFYMEDALRAAGANVSVGGDSADYVVVDRNLVTGQNPFSDHQLAREMIKILDTQVAAKK